MKRIMTLSACAMLLGGCATDMTAGYLGYQAPPRVLLSQEIVDMMPPPVIVEVGMGKTVEGRPQSFYEFKGQPGQTVTVVVRSSGPDTSLYLHGDANDFRRNAEPLAFVGALNMGVGSMRDPDGLNSHLIFTLPEDADGSYVAVVMPQDQAGYTVTVLDGVVPQRELMALPEPIIGSEGKYMSPFTEDNTVTPWVEKGLQAAVAGNVGTALGSLAAMSNSDNLMFSLVGGIAGEKIGREVFLRSMGGWEFIRENSDMSFNTVEDLARYMAYENASHPQYADVLNASYGIYPELRQAMAQVQMETSTLAKLYPHSFIMSAQR